MNVDVRWRSDAPPKDSIRFGAMENQSSCEGGNCYAAQQETAHLSDPGEVLFADAMRGRGVKPRGRNFRRMCPSALGVTPPRFLDVLGSKSRERVYGGD